MMRAWREKNKPVSQMGLQFSNVCKKKKNFSLGAQFFQYTFHGSFLQNKRNYHSWFYFVALLVISRGSFFLFMAKLFRFLFVCWLVVWRRHFDQLIKLEPCCSINYNTYCLKNIQTKHRSMMFHKKDKFYATGRDKGNLVFENDMLKLVNITTV